MAIYCSGCFNNCCKVNPTNSGRWPHLRASAKVEMAGLNIAACANATRFAGDVVLFAALAAC